MTLDDLQIHDADRSVIVHCYRAKNNVFGEKLRKLGIGASHDPRVDLRACVLEVRRLIPGARPGTRLCHLVAGLNYFEQLVAIIQSLIPAIPCTPFVRGAISAHSFRRGFTHAALDAGFSVAQIQVHGDWASPDSVLDYYAVGGVLPSIPITRHLTAMAPFVSPEHLGGVAPSGPRFESMAAAMAPVVAAAPVAVAAMAPAARVAVAASAFSAPGAASIAPGGPQLFQPAAPGPALAPTAWAGQDQALWIAHRPVLPSSSSDIGFARDFSAVNPFAPYDDVSSISGARLKRAREWELL